MERQFFPNEIKGKFYLSNPKSKRPTPIVFMVRLDRKQVKFHTGAKIYPDQWNHSKQLAYISPLLTKTDNANNEIVNNTVDKINLCFLEYKKYICNVEGSIDMISILKDSLSSMGRKRKQHKIENITDIIKRSVMNDTTLKDSTAKNYLNKGIPALEFYLDYLKREKGESIDDFHFFTTEFFNALSLYLVNNYTQPNGEPYTISTINSNLKYAKSAIVLTARAGNYLTDMEISAIKLRQFDDKSSDNHIALRNDEVMKLYRYKCDNERDEIVKDMFLLECTLGHRIADILRIDSRVDRIRGNYYITVAPDKTPNKKVEVGIIFEIAKNILVDKYSCQLPKCNKDLINRNIKRIAKEAGINGEELQSIHYAGESKPTEYKKHRYDCISTHTGRRTFVSLLSARGWSYEKISKFTGQTIEMVEHYDKATAKYIDIYKDTLENEPSDIVRLLTDPECVLKMVGEQEASSAPIMSVDIERLIIEKYEAEKRLEEEKKRAESDATFMRIKYESEIRTQERIKKLMSEGCTEQEAIEILKELGRKSTEMIRSKYENNIQK